jgi:hypothetical protein
MSLRFSNPLRSEFHETNNMRASTGTVDSKNLFVKHYPKFFKREDVHGDFVAVKRELSVAMPHARILKEDIDANIARVKFDVSPSEETLLEKLLAKRGFVLLTSNR